LFTPLIFTSIFVSIQKIDEGAVHAVFSKALDNYIKWCNYLPLRPVWDKYVFSKYTLLLSTELHINTSFGFKILHGFLLALIH
jgi:hypothetical protein